jgi:FkbM family methyltransferase
MWVTETSSGFFEDRVALAGRATELARAAMPGVDVEILWEGTWVRRVGPDYFPDPDMFRLAGNHAEPDWERWAGQARKYRRDAEDYWFHLYKPRAGDTIVDIGAGRGEDVFAFSGAVGPAGRVWAIEPHPVSFEVLRRLCGLNHLANVTPLNCACMDRAQELQMETLPVWESNYVREGDPSPTSYPVKSVRFDDLAAEHAMERIDFLKMNIEGAERWALPGCERALARARFVCIAAHDFRAARGEGDQFRTLDFVKEFLTGAGFAIAIRDDPRYYVPYHVHGWRPGQLA